MTCANVASLTLSADVRYDLSMTTTAHKLTPGMTVEFDSGHGHMRRAKITGTPEPAKSPRMVWVPSVLLTDEPGRHINLYFKRLARVRTV